jgi:serine/threonine protein kinase/TPR repeat protein
MPETTVFDHYEVLRREDGSLFELGRGAMGITYKAFDTNLRCPVALKVINAASIHSDIARQRFVREARSAAVLRHRNVASVFHLGVEGDTYFYAMEFIEGETVESLVRRGGPIEPSLALRIAVQVARALNAAQKHQLVHRDIKPSNLMLVHEDEELVVKVIDFGLAKSSRGEDSTKEITLASAGFVGTPHFASPEQLDELDLDVRSDIYSLGVTLWYMLAGEAPFTGTLAQVMSHHLTSPPPMEKLAAQPEQVRDLLRRMLGKNPSQRPQTPVELRAELEACIESLAASRPAGAPPEADLVITPQSGQTGGAILKNKGFYAGAIIGGRYELLRDLGESNSGWAFQAEDLHDGAKLRLLVLQAEWAGDAGALAQIEREVEKLRTVEHPNILRVLAIERTPEAAFTLLEWTDGFSLLELLRSRQEIDADETVLLLRQIAAGVDAATGWGLRHLDFSLGQIFVHFPIAEKEPERRLATPVDRWPPFLVKINALGITREFATSDTWAGGQTVVGGVAPASPRDATGAPARHCIQSLAAVVYELLGGTLSPGMIGGLGTQPVSRYVPVAALPEAGNEVVKRALDPQRAYPAAMEFCQALSATLLGDYRTQLVHPTSAPTRPPTGLPPVPPAAPAPAAPAPLPHPTRPATVTLLASARPRRQFPWLGIMAVCAFGLAALGLWYMNRSGSEPEVAASATPAPVPAPAAAPASTAAPAVSTTPIPATAASGSPPPAATPTPTPGAAPLMNAKLEEGQDFETAHNWAKAIESYVDFNRTFPGVDTGRIRLETLLASLRPTFGKLPADQFAAVRPAIADAAGQGAVSAMVILADQLRSAAPSDAFAWYCAAAARGDGPAMTQAGLMVSNGAGVPRDYAQSATWFQMAANAGDPSGKTCLAECYLYGTGVKKDERHAIQLLQDGVAGGDVRAMNLLGACFHRGVAGLKNYDEAFQLFTRAHALGFEDAAGNLGVLYMNGDGVARDPRKAVSLFDEGAQAGSPYCMYLLAKCLEFGTGVGQDKSQAESWYRKAAAGGNPMAIEWCNRRHKG